MSKFKLAASLIAGAIAATASRAGGGEECKIKV